MTHDCAGTVDVRCVRMGAEAAALIAQLQGATLPAIGAQAWSTASVQATMEVPGAFASIAVLADEPCGVAVGRYVADEFELLYLGVLPVARRKGLGRTLLADQLDIGWSAGATCCFLEVAQGNRRARGLYHQAGFRQVGRRVGYYPTPDGTRHDALLLRKKLSKR